MLHAWAERVDWLIAPRETVDEDPDATLQPMRLNAMHCTQ